MCCTLLSISEGTYAHQCAEFTTMEGLSSVTSHHTRMFWSCSLFVLNVVVTC
eukprot:m.362263 g.362263  ORF g.362263 m.362263 type:complete len:52 (+) comp20257_c0_seq1:1007-1162(+)